MPERRSLAGVVLLLAAVFFLGCGRKTALIPPQQLVPVAISDLRYELAGDRVILTWTSPVKMESGETLHGIETFEILRADIPAEDYCEGCPVRFDRLVTLDGMSLPADSESQTVSYEETDLRAGYRYLYKVRSRAGWWYPSRDSNEVSFVWRLPPMAPGNLQLAAGDRQLTLSWEPVTDDIAGKPLETVPLYQVYRKSGGADYVTLGEPVHGVKFIDTGLKNEIPYTYRVQAVVAHADFQQRSNFSREAEGLPKDVQPPDRPGSPVAVTTPEGIKLVWQAVANDDLAGYRIYRRAGGASGPELIGEVGVGRNQYIDRDITSGTTWFYSVSAFDRMQPPNESPLSQETAVDF